MASEGQSRQWQPATSWAAAESSLGRGRRVRRPPRPKSNEERSISHKRSKQLTLPQEEYSMEEEEEQREEQGGTRRRVPRSTVEIRTASGKGDGLFATKTIGPGGLVISEAPFMEIDLPLTTERLWQALYVIDVESRNLFWSFDGMDDEAGGNRDVDVAGSNMIPFEGQSRGGMFKTICRTNHSCSPNARWVWRPVERKMSVYALRNIRKGEEVTASYLELAELLSDDRESLIEEKYGFACLCDVCQASISDKRISAQKRSHIAAAFERWEALPIDEWYNSSMSAAYNRTRTLKKMEDIMNFIQDEGLTALEPRLLEHRFMVHAAWGELSAARRVTSKWEEAERIVDKGGQSPDPHVTEIRRNPKRWVEWGKLSKNRQSKSEASTHSSAGSYQTTVILRSASSAQLAKPADSSA